MLQELSLADLNIGSSELIQEDVYKVLSVEGSLKSRDHTGGTAPKQVMRAITSARKLV